MSRLTALSGNSGPTRFHCTVENQHFSIEHSNSSRKASDADVGKKIRSVVLEKHKLENRDKFILNIFLAFLDYQDFNAGTELIVFQPSTPQKVKIFLTETLVDEVKPLVMEKYEFD